MRMMQVRIANTKKISRATNIWFWGWYIVYTMRRPSFPKGHWKRSMIGSDSILLGISGKSLPTIVWGRVAAVVEAVDVAKSAAWLLRRGAPDTAQSYVIVVGSIVVILYPVQNGNSWWAIWRIGSGARIPPIFWLWRTPISLSRVSLGLERCQW